MPNEALTITRYGFDGSSSLKSAGYDEVRRILSLEFLAGSIFHYYDVDPGVVEELGQAESKGQFYAKRIRGIYRGAPMTGMCPECKAKPELIGERCSKCEKAIVREIDRQHKG